MDARLLAIQAQIFAAIAEMEAMKAVNAQYAARGEPPPRGEEDFIRVSDWLNVLANDARTYL